LGEESISIEACRAALGGVDSTERNVGGGSEWTAGTMELLSSNFEVTLVLSKDLAFPARNPRSSTVRILIKEVLEVTYCAIYVLAKWAA
jgi:hypothetical protein